MVKIDLNTDKLEEYEKELINYDGYLPSLIRWGISTQYLQNILKSDKASEVEQQMLQSRNYTYEELYDELIRWCKENKEYEDILI